MTFGRHPVIRDVWTGFPDIVIAKLVLIWHFPLRMLLGPVLNLAKFGCVGKPASNVQKVLFIFQMPSCITANILQRDAGTTGSLLTNPFTYCI